MRFALFALLGLAFGTWTAARAAAGDPPAPAGTEPPAPAPANRLARESSPYLLQHAHNPVDWYPWGAEAFARAQAEDKPIFLSIGYSTCHWCHVMERESFENREIADVLNRWFVPIKVDREERPDVDAVYMDAVIAMAGDGGWPLSVFLTPELKPFFGGTYFPPNDRYGRPGFKRLLELLHEKWTGDRTELLAGAGEVVKLLADRAAPVAALPLDDKLFASALDNFWAFFDPQNGGFGRRTKFPRSHALSCLLRLGRKTGDGRADEMVRRTLDHMARGGMYDQAGGGFHRYSVDPEWHVPHFEKMLYDQALLAWTYLEAWQAFKDPEYARIARETLDYCLRDLADPAGGFHSAEDADSEGVEGKFYLWTPAEIAAALGAGPEAERIARFYDVTAAGNFEEGKSILRVQVECAAFAQAEGIEPAAFARALGPARVRLLAARARRVRPHKDDKVLAGWNGLLIRALALAGSALGEPKYLAAAARAADFVLGTLQRDGRLLRRYRAGKADVPAFAEDYAYVAWGLAGLYEATFDARWLAEARRLALDLVRRFGDEAGGGALWFAAHDGEPLIARTREVYDGATPSSNSVAALVCLRLGRLTGDVALEESGRKILAAFSATLAGQPEAYPMLLSAQLFAAGPTREVLLTGDPADPALAALAAVARARFCPEQVIALFPADAAARAPIEQLIPFAKGLAAPGGKPAAFVCENFTCRAPVQQPAELEQALDQIHRR
ncbi:MAG: thioredoxin domain-containing protein [Planctomycetes bacterium]|nr:thioredoxin domain-containing protein [Planctomycetota bacterium]